MYWRRRWVTAAGGLDTDTEALQTDIQRFLAILGFCLMAVFALVQSLPMAPAPDEARSERLSRKLDEQKRRIEALQEEVKALAAHLDRQQEDARQAAEKTRSTRRLEARIDALRAALADLLTERLAREQALAAYSRRMAEREREIRSLADEKARIAAALKKKTAAVSDLQAQRAEDRHEPAAKPRTDSTRSTDSRQPETDRRQGVYVAFASDEALLALLRERKIALFITVEPLAEGFSVRFDGGRISFEQAAQPNGLDLWQLGEGQVPAAILERFAAWTTLARRPKRFIVGLPAEMSGRIRGAGSGDFIIGADGTVRRKGR